MRISPAKTEAAADAFPRIRAVADPGARGFFSFSDAHQYVVNLTGVANAQDIVLTLTNVADTAGSRSDTVHLQLGLLVGDSYGGGVVNSGDAQQTRNRSGQTPDATTFRSDYNLDGTINSGDATVVRSRSGQVIP